MHFAYPALLINENSGRKIFDVGELWQGFSRLVGVGAFYTCYQHGVANIKTLFEFTQAGGASGKISTQFIRQRHNFYLRHFLPVVVVAQKFCFVHTVGAPATHDLYNGHFPFEAVVGQAYHVAVQIGKAKLQAAFARLHAGSGSSYIWQAGLRIPHGFESIAGGIAAKKYTIYNAVLRSLSFECINMSTVKSSEVQFLSTHPTF